MLEIFRQQWASELDPLSARGAGKKRRLDAPRAVGVPGVPGVPSLLERHQGAAVVPEAEAEAEAPEVVQPLLVIPCASSWGEQRVVERQAGAKSGQFMHTVAGADTDEEARA